MAEPTQKVCNICKKMKSIDNYVKNDNILKNCLICREYKKANKEKNKCIHNRRKSLCKNCDGTSICIHRREKSKCKECGGTSICIHRREKNRCKECGNEVHKTIKIMISASKNKDKKYNRYEEDKFVDYDYVKELIEKSQDKCYYCICQLQYIIYQVL
jgi:hypothetical protein